MAFSARADSVKPRATATLTNCAFSAGDGRAVIEGTDSASARELTRRFPGPKAHKAMLVDCSRTSPRPIAREGPNRPRCARCRSCTAWRHPFDPDVPIAGGYNHGPSSLENQPRYCTSFGKNSKLFCRNRRRKAPILRHRVGVRLLGIWVLRAGSGRINAAVLTGSCCKRGHPAIRPTTVFSPLLSYGWSKTDSRSVISAADTQPAGPSQQGQSGQCRSIYQRAA